MVGLPAARVSDLHVCPLCVVPSPILPPGAMTVIIGGLPAARMTDKCVCVPPPPAPPIPPPFDLIIKGSTTVIIMGKPAARMMDNTMKGGMIMPPCCVTVLIGEVGVVAPAVPAVPFPNVWEELLPDGSTVTHVGANITIAGDKAFRDRVVADLQALNATPTGNSLISSLNAPGKGPVKIQKSADGTNSATANSHDGWMRPDGTPGPGAGSVVDYNPDRVTIGDGSEPWMNRPPAIGLGHELVHVEQGNNGTLSRNKTAGVEHDESQAVGLPPFENNTHTENKMRQEMGQPPRPRY